MKYFLLQQIAGYSTITSTEYYEYILSSVKAITDLKKALTNFQEVYRLEVVGTILSMASTIGLTSHLQALTLCDIMSVSF